MNPVQAYKKINSAIEGGPEWILTTGLLIIASIAALVALFASPIIKGIVMAWFIMP